MKIGFWELVVVVIVAFVFIGPDQLPVYAKKIGKMLRELKKYTGAASEEIQKNVVEPLNEIQAPLKEAVAPLTDIKKDIDNSVKDVTKSFTGIGKTSKEEAAKKAAEAEEVTDLTEDAVEELPEQPAEAPAEVAESVEAPAEKPEQAAAEADRSAAAQNASADALESQIADHRTALPYPQRRDAQAALDRLETARSTLRTGMDTAQRQLKQAEQAAAADLLDFLQTDFCLNAFQEYCFIVG